MKLRSLALVLWCGAIFALTSCANVPAAMPSPSPASAPEAAPPPVAPVATAPALGKDRLDIRSVNFLKARAPEFLIFVVKADYVLASSAEGNVALAIDFTPGSYTVLTEQRVNRGSGSVELLAECKRSTRTLQGVSVNLSEYPSGLPRTTLAGQTRTVTLPTAP